ncbi:MAG: FHA domain-containing protein [Kofleriaceae bacterium]
MRCSVCGHESPPGSSFCLNCGSAIAPAVQQQTPVAATGLPGGPVFCPSCRGENAPGMKFCRLCGTTLAQTVATAPAAPAYGAPGMGFIPATLPQQNIPATLPQGMPPGIAATAPGKGFGPGGAPMATPPPQPRPSSGALPQPGRPMVVAQGSTITCPRCGTATPVGFAYCQQCGLHIQPIAPTDPGATPSRARPPTSQPLGGIDPQGATIAQPDGAIIRPSQPGSAVPMAVRIKEPSARAGVGWGTAILVNRDGSDGQRYPLTADDTVIGRAGADIAFDDDRFLAKQHARFERSPDGTLKIHPIDMLNGVFKKADGPVELSDGTIILVGREVLQFETITPEEKTVHPLVRHGVSLFGSPPREPYARLMQLVPSGGYRDVRHLIVEETVLGREEGDIVFRDDAFMSRRHAAVNWDGKRAQITDLGSSNGTFVRILAPTALKHGDHVRMGDQLLRIELAR